MRYFLILCTCIAVYMAIHNDQCYWCYWSIKLMHHHTYFQIKLWNAFYTTMQQSIAYSGPHTVLRFYSLVCNRPYVAWPLVLTGHWLALHSLKFNTLYCHTIPAVVLL